MEKDSLSNDYNTSREKLILPEYGRNVQKMVEDLKQIEDRDKRSAQARGIIRTMERIHPQTGASGDTEQKLWDHLFIMAGYDLDIDAPYPMPAKEEKLITPSPIPLDKSKIEAREYGRNIEKIIKLIAFEPDGDQKNSLIRDLAIYMRQQYLIWNKNNVADETIFADIERISCDILGEAHMIHVPDGLMLSKISDDTVFSRPGLNLYGVKNQRQNQKRNYQKRKR